MFIFSTFSTFLHLPIPILGKECNIYFIGILEPPSVTKTKPTSLAALPHPIGLKSILSRFKVSLQVTAAIKLKLGGGVIRRSSVTAALRPAPYYPSQKLNRLSATANKL